MKCELKQLKDGTWVWRMDEETLKAAISMIRLEWGNGWSEIINDPAEEAAGKRVIDEIDRAW